METDSIALRKALQLVAPGTELREGLERIQRSHTGALIILGYSPEVEALCSRVILIHQGKIVQDTGIEEFKGKFSNLEEAFANYTS